LISIKQQKNEQMANARGHFTLVFMFKHFSANHVRVVVVAMR
jgi:hypothetical protein